MILLNFWKLLNEIFSGGLRRADQSRADRDGGLGDDMSKAAEGDQEEAGDGGRAWWSRQGYVHIDIALK